MSPYDEDLDLLPYIPERYKNPASPMRVVLLSVTTEIHRQIGALERQKKKPAVIKLGPVCSVRFCYEQNGRDIRIERGPKEYLGLPVRYRYRREGVFVVAKLPAPFSALSAISSFANNVRLWLL